MRVEKTITTEYGRGRYSALHEMIEYINKEIGEIKKKGMPPPNSPRQITEGGKLLAYNKVLQKLLVKKQKTIEHE